MSQQQAQPNAIDSLGARVDSRKKENFRGLRLYRVDGMKGFFSLLVMVALVAALSAQSKRKKVAGKKPQPKIESPCGVRQTLDEFIEEISIPWRIAAVSKEHTFYYSTSKIVCGDHGVLKVWIKSVAKQLNDNVAYSMTQYELKCKSDQLRIVNSVDYDKEGKVIDSNNSGEDKFSDAIPESVGEGILDAVCHKP